jgi:DNA polymerase III subunit delta
MVKSEPSVFLFVGEERYLKENALMRLKASLLEGGSKDLDQKVFYGGESNAAEILEYAAAPSFFAPKNLVILRDFEKFAREDRSRIAEYVKNPNKSSCLVIDIKESHTAAQINPGAGHVKVMHFNEIDESEAPSWIKRFLALKGKTIDDDAIDILKDMRGGGLLFLTNELEKLAVFVGDRPEIKAGDVEMVAGKSADISAFDLGWAIGEGDIDRAMNIVSELALSGKRSYEIIGLLSWHMTRILKGRMLLDKGESEYSIASMLKIARRYQAQFFKQVRMFDLVRIKSKMDILMESDLDIKRTKFDPGLVIEFAVIRLCLG